MRVNYWNRSMAAITGITRDEAFNKAITVLLPWLPVNTLLKNEENEEFAETEERLTFKINMSPFKDPSGGYVVILEDITEKQMMGEQLQQASKLASIGKLTAGISHEIGNPLASISSLVQELRASDLDTPEEREFRGESLKTINNHIERIATIVRSLGDFARTSSRKKIACAVPDILERTLSLVKYDKRFRDLRLTIEISKVPSILANPEQMQQVFLNLMFNAVDAMPQGGSLAITARQEGAFLTIVFTDTGPGIEETAIDKIFDPFFTTKPLGKGTGLGLSICYGIIREHKGTIDFSSKRGEGTSFTIRLPLNIDG